MKPSIKIFKSVIIAYIFLGVFLGEAFDFFKIFIPKIYNFYLNNLNRDILFLILYYIILFLIYFNWSVLSKKIKLILKSKRIDILVTLIFGLLISFKLDIFILLKKVKFPDSLNSYEKILDKIILIDNKYNNLLSTIIIGILIIYITFYLNKYVKKKVIELNLKKSGYLSDDPINNFYEDKFDFTDLADRFSDQLYNQGHSDSLIFALDAPWGTGKTSFINLCFDKLKKKHNHQILMYTFNVSDINNYDNFIEKFTIDLVHFLKNEIFLPELQPLLFKYMKAIKKSNFTQAAKGFNLSISLFGYTLDSLFYALEETLKNINRKIIIVIDDMDRIDYNSMKSILVLLKRFYKLPNISYLICYDTDNISNQSYSSYRGRQSNKKNEIIEYLEKYINIKASLFLKLDDVRNYFLDEYKKICKVNDETKSLVFEKIILGIEKIFFQEDYFQYQFFIGNPRKIKRLLNLIITLNLEDTDFKNFDINIEDFVNLLLIYLYYPSIFRRIIDTELSTYKPYFTRNNEDKNTELYCGFLNELDHKQQFLLNKVFELPKNQYDYRLGNEFNSSAYIKKNLLMYIDLILSNKKPNIIEQVSFYESLLEKLFNKKSNLEEILLLEEFKVNNNDETHSNLWRHIVNSKRNLFYPGLSDLIINYAISILPNYSIVSLNNISRFGFRKEFISYIVTFLDDKGWIDQNGKITNNNYEGNVKKISDMIFGENKHTSILEIIGSRDKGILGFYDLLNFRYLCNSRNTSLQNIPKALTKHNNALNPTSGLSSELIVPELENISIKIFEIFKQNYIDSETNFIDELDKLNPEDMYSTYKGNMSLSEIDESVLFIKQAIQVQIINQLCSDKLDINLGCGYYKINLNGNEKNIKELMNTYLFKVCFTIKDQSIVSFLKLLVLLYPRNCENMNTKELRSIYTPILYNIFDKKMLFDHWKMIKSNNLIKQYRPESLKILNISFNFLVRKVIKIMHKITNEEV